MMPTEQSTDDRELLESLIDDGRPLLKLLALLLILAGLFAFFLAATGNFLPHDIAYLGMTSEQLCLVAECRVVHFMMHDRVSFGGALVGVAVLYPLPDDPDVARVVVAQRSCAMSPTRGANS